MNTLIPLCIALSAAPPASSPSDLEVWIDAARSKLEDTPTARVFEQQRAAASASVDAALLQSPWTARSLLTHGQQFPRNGTSFVPRIGMSLPTARSWEATLSGSLQFQNRSRWAVQLEGAAGYFDEPTVDGLQQNDVPFSVDLSVTYDVVGPHGGRAAPRRGRRPRARRAAPHPAGGRPVREPV